ncbi:MAG TPA: hypothetical protein ENH13_06260 [Euryarchaeota archaeon]|nr:hypothetical protein [Euryarchaeota archaeon]
MDEEKWQNRFTNLWLAGEQGGELVHSIEPIIKPSMERNIVESRDVLSGNSQAEVSLDREEWLEKFAGLWLAEKKARLVNRPEKTSLNNPAVQIPDLMSELSSGKVVIGQSRINPADKNMEPRDAAPGPDDLIVFDIDPEIAIKLLTAKKGFSS